MASLGDLNHFSYPNPGVWIIKDVVYLAKLLHFPRACQSDKYYYSITGLLGVGYTRLRVAIVVVSHSCPVQRHVQVYLTSAGECLEYLA